MFWCVKLRHQRVRGSQIHLKPVKIQEFDLSPDLITLNIVLPFPVRLSVGVQKGVASGLMGSAQPPTAPGCPEAPPRIRSAMHGVLSCFWLFKGSGGLCLSLSACSVLIRKLGMI